jgi:hypothetical protein
MASCAIPCSLCTARPCRASSAERVTKRGNPPPPRSNSAPRGRLTRKQKCLIARSERLLSSVSRKLVARESSWTAFSGNQVDQPESVLIPAPRNDAARACIGCPPVAPALGRRRGFASHGSDHTSAQEQCVRPMSQLIYVNRTPPQGLTRRPR